MNRLFLNKELYTVDAIEKAQQAFNDLANTDYATNDNYHILTFKMCLYDSQITIKEFENYMVNLMGSRNVK